MHDSMGHFSINHVVNTMQAFRSRSSGLVHGSCVVDDSIMEASGPSRHQYVEQTQNSKAKNFWAGTKANGGSRSLKPQVLSSQEPSKWVYLHHLDIGEYPSKIISFQFHGSMRCTRNLVQVSYPHTPMIPIGFLQEETWKVLPGKSLFYA